MLKSEKFDILKDNFYKLEQNTSQLVLFPRFINCTTYFGSQYFKLIPFFRSIVLGLGFHH